MEELVRRILGYVEFYAEKGDFERFLTLCAKNEIRVWNVRKEEDGMYGCAAIYSYKAFTWLRRRTAVKTKILKKKGLPFLVKPIFKRKGIIFGAVLFAIIYMFLSSHIWSVTVEGNTTIDADEVLSAAKELGLYEGVLKKSIDPPMLKENLMYALDDTSWISVNTLGCTATICIKEKTKAPLVADKSQPTNVYASYSGQIIEMDVFGGEAKVKVGDAVSAGEMLISGVMKDLQEEIYLTHAYGKIIARTRRTLQVEIPKTENVWQETQTQIYRCSANIFGIDIPLTFREAPKGNYKREHERFPFCIGQIKLPVMVYREKWILIEETEIINEKEDAKNKGKEEMERLFKETSPDAQIEKSSFTFKEEKNRYVYSGVFICREDIAKVSEFIDKLLYFEE